MKDIPTEEQIARHREYKARLCIDFAEWYSGMDREKVEKAYNRYLKEKRSVNEPK